MGREPGPSDRLYARVCGQAWDACAADGDETFDLCGCISWGRSTESLCYDETLAFFACMDGRDIADYECSFTTVIPVDGVCSEEFDAVLAC